MKFVHLADLHIGRRFGDYSMLEDQSFALDGVIDSVQSLCPDAVFISGDVYDKSVPSEDAVALADDFLTKLTDICAHVLVIGGNHDSQTRLSFANRLLKSRGLYVSGEFSGKLERVCIDGTDVWLMPHIRPREVARFFENPVSSTQNAIEEILKEIPHSDRSIILAHQFISGAGVERCESETEPIGGLNPVDSGLFEGFKYVALGHLHKPQRVIKNYIRYSGSLIKYSFSELNHKKSFVYGELSDRGVDIKLKPIPFLRDVRVITGTLDEILNTPGNADDYIRAVLTDELFPISPGSRLGCAYPHLVSIGWNPPGRTEEVSEFVPGEESPKGILEEFFRGMNGREMTKAENRYIDDIWRSVGEELGK